MRAGEAGASHNACLHIDSLCFDDVIILLTVLKMLCSVFQAYFKIVFLFCLFIIQPWFYHVVKYCFNAIYFTSFIFVNSIIVSSNISCNDLSWDFIVIYVWYFVNWNSISVQGAIWSSLSPCTVIKPILLPKTQLHCGFLSRALSSFYV